MQEKYIISAYHNEERKESKKQEWAYLFDVKADKNQKGIIIN